jgi:hypothetical protein
VKARRTVRVQELFDAIHACTDIAELSDKWVGEAGGLRVWVPGKGASLASEICNAIMEEFNGRRLALKAKPVGRRPAARRVAMLRDEKKSESTHVYFIMGAAIASPTGLYREDGLKNPVPVTVSELAAMKKAGFKVPGFVKPQGER